MIIDAVGNETPSEQKGLNAFLFFRRALEDEQYTQAFQCLSHMFSIFALLGLKHCMTDAFTVLL